MFKILFYFPIWFYFREILETEIYINNILETSAHFTENPHTHILTTPWMFRGETQDLYLGGVIRHVQMGFFCKMRGCGMLKSAVQILDIFIVQGDFCSSKCLTFIWALKLSQLFSPLQTKLFYLFDRKWFSYGGLMLYISVLFSFRLMFVDPCIIVQFMKKNPTRCNNVSKLYYFIFIWSSTCFGRHAARHQEPKTALAASGFAYVESFWTCSWWTLSGTECLTTSTNYTSTNLPRMQNQRLLVQF